MTTYVDIYFQLFLFTEILLTFLFSNMSKIDPPYALSYFLYRSYLIIFMTTYVDIYFQLFLFTEILLTFLFSNMSKIVSQLLEIVRNTELNRYSAADRLSLVA